MCMDLIIWIQKYTSDIVLEDWIMHSVNFGNSALWSGSWGPWIYIHSISLCALIGHLCILLSHTKEQWVSFWHRIILAVAQTLKAAVATYLISWLVPDSSLPFVADSWYMAVISEQEFWWEKWYLGMIWGMLLCCSLGAPELPSIIVGKVLTGIWIESDSCRASGSAGHICTGVKRLVRWEEDSG